VESYQSDIWYIRARTLLPSAFTLCYKLTGFTTINTKHPSNDPHLSLMNSHLIQCEYANSASGQSYLTKGRSTPANESFNRLQPENVEFKDDMQ